MKLIDTVSSMKGDQRRVYSLFEFALAPTKVAVGTQKLKAYIKNIGDGVLRNIVLLLHSSNERNVSVKGCERFIHALMPGQEAGVDFQVSVADNANVYFSLSGFKNGDVFFRADSTRYKILVEEAKSKAHS